MSHSDPTVPALRRRWLAIKDAFDPTGFEAFADLGSEANRRLTLVVLGGMAICGGVIGTAALAPYSARLDIPFPTTLSIGAVLVGLGALAWMLPARTPALAIEGVIAGGVLAVTVAVWQGTGRVAGDTVLFYGWVAIAVVMLRSKTARMFHFSLIAAASGVVFAFDDTFTEPLFWWGVILLVLLLVWQSMGWLVDRGRDLALRERRARAEAEAASLELEVVNDRKSRFLATMSHELRTPLNAILGFAEMLRRQVAGPLDEHQQAYVDDIVESGQHLLALIDDTLDEAVVEGGQHALTPTEFDVADLVEGALTLVRERARQAQITLVVRAEGMGTAVLDARKIRQVLVNLLSNAVKFTPAGGTVTVEVTRAGRGLSFSVSDTGPGIPADQHDAIFEEFRQTDGAVESPEGTGLGLAVSKQLVELHGGRIGVTSQPGAGARFEFSVPTQPPVSSENEPEARTTFGRLRRAPAYIVSMRSLVRRSAFHGSCIGVGCLFGFVVVEAPDVNTAYFGFAPIYVWTVAAIAVAGAAFLSSRWLTYLALSVAFASTIVTAFGFYHLGPLAPSAALVWVWETFFIRVVFVKLGIRGSEIHLVLVAVASAVIIAITPGNEAPVAQWLAVVSTIWVGSFFVSWLLRNLQDLAAAEQRAADDAARIGAELDRATQHKSQFLAGMSHELRTPLTAVIGFGEALERGVAGDLAPEQQEYVTSIVSSGRHLLALINDVLDLAKIDAGKLALSPAEVDLAVICHDAALRAKRLAEGRDVDVVTNDPVELPAVVDEARTRRVLDELLAHAVGITGPGGTVMLAAGQDGLATYVSVTDQGPGLSASEAATLFEEFGNAARDPSQSNQGPGLGLALAGRLVEMHGGSISVEAGNGVGTTLRARFPHAHARAVPITPTAATAAESMKGT